MQVKSAENSLVYKSVIHSTGVTQEQSNVEDRIFYSPEKYGCFENFESSRDFTFYLKQIKNDFYSVAKNINLHEPPHENIHIFCSKIAFHQNTSPIFKELLYTNLNDYLFSIKKFTENNLFEEKTLCKKYIGKYIFRVDRK
ncbi:hypothetical protein ABK905_03445 [Acerihabitans sp. KWT182]|uniref:Uncharacterized protein n=1 Tax=Acerihabitans sp. KWT182 TaxID=3157919 RepID=A0AAU7QB73_9GAMM